MSISALKKLTIEHLRGSVIPFGLIFEKGKKLTVIYGENGTGKTTICDAFEFLGKGKVGSLENRGLGKTSPYWHSIGKTASDVSVVLESDDSSCTAKIHKGDVVAIPAAARPRVEVLRRNQILTLVEARPGDRYAAISRFIDVSGIEASEASLRNLISDLKKGRDTAIARVQENEDTIRQFWESAGKSGKDPIHWAEHESARDLSVLQTELEALGKMRTAYLRFADYSVKIDAGTAALDSAKSLATAAGTTLDELLANVVEGAGDLVGILEAAKPYLDNHPNPGHCPLCESAENVATLRERVAERTAQFTALQKAKREKHNADLEVHAAERRLTQLHEDFLHDQAAFDQAQQAYKWEADIPLPKEECPADVTLLGGWLSATAQLPEEWLKAESARQEQSQFFATLKQALKTYRTNIQAQNDLDQLLPRLERSLEVVMEERRMFTDGVLKAIAADVGRIYEAVHPGEGLNKISLELDPNKRASLEIGASFAGQADTPPQAYFSQSHLDTLGICVFLALAMLEKPSETILVLDDVLASVDEPHVDRLIEMLYTETIKFRHCIITTHYRPWKQKLRWGWLQNGQCHFVELTKWTTMNGLSLIRSLPDIERLRQLLAETPPDPQLVCAKAGVILEAVLDFLTLLYECPAPRRTSGLYTLGDLLPAIDKKLRQALSVDVLKGYDAAGAPTYELISLAPILDELTRIAQARNVFGAHFSAISFELLDSDAIGFGQQVLSLVDVLTDSNSGWPRSSKSGSYWSTSGETRRLHPLQKPT
jgi:hypothetical protein